MSKRKTTVYLDAEVLRAAKVFAARKDLRESEVLEAALRRYLGLDLIGRFARRSDLSEEQAERLAYEELHAARKER